MKKLILLAAVMLLAGCSTLENYEKEQQSLVCLRVSGGAGPASKPSGDGAFLILPKTVTGAVSFNNSCLPVANLTLGREDKFNIVAGTEVTK